MLYKVKLGILRLHQTVSEDDCFCFPLMNRETAERVSMDSLAPNPLQRPGEMTLLVEAPHADEVKDKALAALHLTWVEVISCNLEPVLAGVAVLEEAHEIPPPLSPTMTPAPTFREVHYDDWCVGLKPVTETREEVPV